jgi:YVTN family beta-propeller protein
MLVKSDGEDLWVANNGSDSVSQVHASNGKLLGTWTGATNAIGVLVAMGRVFVTGSATPGNLYMIDPTGVVGAVTVVSNALGIGPQGIAFDGSKIWTANEGNGGPGSGGVSIVTPGMSTPWSATNVTTGLQSPRGILFDGTNIWVTDFSASTLLKLDPSGAILQTVNVGNRPFFPAFDGTNIWVPNLGDNSVTVVRAVTGAVMATLSGNGVNGPWQAAFDGQRILVTNQGGQSVSLWKAADLTPIGTFPTGASTDPTGACSDGTYFWITLFSSSQLARF